MHKHIPCYLIIIVIIAFNKSSAYRQTGEDSLENVLQKNCCIIS